MIIQITENQLFHLNAVALWKITFIQQTQSAK